MLFDIGRTLCYHSNMKTCHRCKESKDFSEYNKNASKKDGLAVTCRDCMKVLRKIHYEANKEACVADARARSARNKAIVVEKLYEFLKENPCIDCGNADVRVLEFDHVDAEQKEKNVSLLVSLGNGWDRVKREIDKCEVRCANCHRIKTQLQLGSFRLAWHTRV